MALLKSIGSQNRPRKLLIQPSANSPFCTSPSQLHEVTRDPDATNFTNVGMRSPGALTSGRTVKEIDEQLSSLKKENFNLKLRIYFLEEGRKDSNCTAVKEEIVKKNVELQVELTNLQKELENKQELLCQAAKAMEIEEEEHKKEISMRDQEINDLKEMLVEIQDQLKNEREEIKQVALCAEAFDINIGEGDSLNVIRKFQIKIQDLQEELKKEQNRSGQTNVIIESMREDCKVLNNQILEKDLEITALTTELQQTKNKLSERITCLRNLEETILEKNSQVEMAVKQSSLKDDELCKQKKSVEDMNKLCTAITEERSKLEKRVEKYKWQCCISEKRIEELTSSVDSLKHKIHSLESRNASLVEEAKRVASDNIASTAEKFKLKNNDDPLFSVRITPRMSDSPKSASTKAASPLKFVKSRSPMGSPLYCDPEENITSKLMKGDGKQQTDLTEYKESYTYEEVVELKKNHFKACKIIKTMIQKRKEYLEQIEKLKKSNAEKMEEIKAFKKKLSDKPCTSITDKKKSIKERVSELNLTASLNPSAAKENSMAEDNDMELALRYKELANELEEKIEILTATLAEKDLQLERFKMDIQEKADKIIDLEFELLAYVNGVDESPKDLTLNEKEHQIQKLENELRKRTGDLQGIVNNELWEKNRTIEKLQTLVKSKEETVSKLEKSQNNKDLQLKILKDKINELGIHINLPSELINSSNNDQSCEHADLIQQIEQLKLQLSNVPEQENKKSERLQLQCESLQAKLHKSEKSREEEREICSILNNRLEELCHFLQSLLKHKSVFGFLGNEQSRQLQHALNKSLEFSQSLSNSICPNNDSLMQQSSITNLLNSTRNDNISFINLIDEDNATLSIIANDISLTYHSHLNRINNESDVITVLRQQIANLKHEIEVRDVELERVRSEPSLKMDVEKSPSRKQDQSESESWSEPDRSVSLARIGLEDESLKRHNNSRRRCNAELRPSTESTEEEKNHSKTPSKRATLAESRQAIITLHEQITELEESLKQKDNQLVSIQMSHYETDKLFKLEQGKLLNLMDENRRLLSTIAEYSTEAEENREITNNLRIEQKQLIAQLGELKKEFDITTTQKDELEQQIVKLKEIIVNLEEFKRAITISNSVKDKQMQNTLNEMEIERSHLVETSKNLENTLEKVKMDLQKSQIEFQRVCLREEQIRKELEEKDEEKINEIQVLKQEHEKLMKVKENCITQSELKLVQLKKDVENLEITINKDIQIKRNLEDKVGDLYKQLDKTNLQYSEVMLEKSKLKNENNILQNTINKLQEKEILLNKELNEITSKYTEQLSDLENQNFLISAQLENLRKIQATKTLSSSLPNNLSIFTYRRQTSDHSGYASEDVPVEQVEQNHLLDLMGQNVNMLDGIEDRERLHATASPDLGIESDQGRFSSLEANINVSRPFLPSLEIAQNMNDLLNPVEDASCVNEECCKKVKQIANENIDLRKRLLRTRRALEDTLTRLTIANKQKKEVERSICKQIHKTSQVLRKAKANLDSGSETDNIRS